MSIYAKVQLVTKNVYYVRDISKVILLVTEKYDRYFKINFMSMSKMHLKQYGFTYSAIWTIYKNQKTNKKVKKQEILNIFIKMNWQKHGFRMIWLMGILTIQIISNMIDIKEILLQCFEKSLVKVVLLCLLQLLQL